jgi:hypothetical protein
VVLGWNALGIGGVLMQIVIRMRELFVEIQKDQPADATV